LSERLERIWQLPLDYIPNPQFGEPGAEAMILAEMPPSTEPAAKPVVPRGLPGYLATLYEIPLLTREQEMHLFRKFNYLKFKAAELRDRLATGTVTRKLLDQVEALYDKAVEVKHQIVRANLRLVVSIAKRYMRPGRNLWDLVSDGNMSLMKAVDKFDFSRGNKISTYATWAIMKNFGRSLTNEQRYRARFHTSHAETLGMWEERRSDEQQSERAQLQRAAQVQRIMERLNEREKTIVMYRFGLLEGREPQTLEDIGMEIGVSKERVRQIQIRALNKLRIAAEEEHIELPGVA
jgi:RNA polymerase primary sigma factor/RNA polymerase sigma factor